MVSCLAVFCLLPVCANAGELAATPNTSAYTFAAVAAADSVDEAKIAVLWGDTVHEDAARRLVSMVEKLLHYYLRVYAVRL